MHVLFKLVKWESIYVIMKGQKNLMGTFFWWTRVTPNFSGTLMRCSLPRTFLFTLITSLYKTNTNNKCPDFNNWKGNSRGRKRKGKISRELKKARRKNRREKGQQHVLQVVVGDVELAVAGVRSVVAVVGIPVAGAGLVVLERRLEPSGDSVAVELLVGWWRLVDLRNVSWVSRLVLHAMLLLLMLWLYSLIFISYLLFLFHHLFSPFYLNIFHDIKFVYTVYTNIKVVTELYICAVNLCYHRAIFFNKQIEKDYRKRNILISW